MRHDINEQNYFISRNTLNKTLIFFQHFLEHNCTVQEYGSIPIWEPCNYASNVCYYHAFVEICHHEGWSMPEYAGTKGYSF